MNNVMTDPRQLYGRSLDQAERLFASVRPDQLGLPTPCDEFDVRTLLGHIVRGLRRAAAVGRGEPAYSVKLEMTGVPDDAWSAEFAAARREVEDGWSDDERLDIEVTVPWGTVPGRGALFGYVQEVTMHTWDLAKALGRTGKLDPAIAEPVVGLATQMVPAEPRGGRIPFGPVVPVPAEPGPYDRLAGHLGRKP